MEYWGFIVLGYFTFFIISYIIINPMLWVSKEVTPSFVMLAFAIYYGAFIIAQISLAVRRLHDTNRSGWWLWASFIPLIGTIWILILFCLDGTVGRNRFGPDPKRRYKP